MFETHPAGTHHAHAATAFLVPLGRLLFVAIFLMSAPMHFSSQAIEHARHAGVPAADVLVPISGVLALLGGLSACSASGRVSARGSSSCSSSRSR
jgi:hypothetical protein